MPEENEISPDILEFKNKNTDLINQNLSNILVNLNENDNFGDVINHVFNTTLIEIEQEYIHSNIESTIKETLRDNWIFEKSENSRYKFLDFTNLVETLSKVSNECDSKMRKVFKDNRDNPELSEEFLLFWKDSNEYYNIFIESLCSVTGVSEELRNVETKEDAMTLMLCMIEMHISTLITYKLVKLEHRYDPKENIYHIPSIVKIDDYVSKDDKDRNINVYYDETLKRINEVFSIQMSSGLILSDIKKYSEAIEINIKLYDDLMEIGKYNEKIKEISKSKYKKDNDLIKSIVKTFTRTLDDDKLDDTVYYREEESKALELKEEFTEEIYDTVLSEDYNGIVGYSIFIINSIKTIMNDLNESIKDKNKTCEEKERYIKDLSTVDKLLSNTLYREEYNDIDITIKAMKEEEFEYISEDIKEILIKNLRNKKY